MNILMISTDRKIFEPESAVRLRMIEYAGLFDRLDIIVFGKRGLSPEPIALAVNCRVYSTESPSPLLYIFDAIKIGKKILRDNSGWIITCQDPFETGLVGWRLSREFGAKLNLQIHTDLMNPYFKRQYVKNRVRVFIAKFLLPKADCVRVVSKRIKDSLVGLRLKKLPTVLPLFLGMDDNLVSPPAQLNLHEKYPRFDFIVLMAARLTEEKNFSVALRAFAKAFRRAPKIGLVIGGEGPERGRVEDLIKKLKLGVSVVMENWVVDLRAYYETADLFFITSNYEGHARTMLEVSQVGCPILTSDTGAVGELFTAENCLICPVGDIACFAEKLVFAYENRETIGALGQAAKEAVKKEFNFSPEEYLKRYRASLLECLEDCRATRQIR